MRRVLLFVILICIAILTNAQETKTSKFPPIKSGTNAQQLKTNVQQLKIAPAIPIRQAGNAQQPKTGQEITIPLRKTDPVVNTRPVSAKLTTSQEKTGGKLSSDYSAKEARELLLKQNDSAGKIKTRLPTHPAN